MQLFTRSLSESQKAEKSREKGEGKVMRPPSPTKDSKELSDEATRKIAVECLKEHLELEIQGTKASTEMALEILIHAASLGQSIEASCAELIGSADSNTLRGYLNEAFTAASLSELESQVNAALANELPKKVHLKPQELAIDLHEQPFYGKDEDLLKYASRGQAKAGTTYFYRIASIYLMLKGIRVTLGVVFVHAELSLVDAVACLVEKVQARNVVVKCLYLDRGFATTSMIQYLQQHTIPAIIACPIRGKPEGKGSRSLCKGRKSYQTKHTFRSPGQGDCTVPVAVMHSFTRTSKRGQKKKRKARWFVYILVHVNFKLQQIHGRYRQRFGIESSYRLMRQLRIRTNSRNPAMRFLFMALGLILVNVWLGLRFRFTQLPRRGRAGRPLDEARFRLKRFASFLRHAIERRYRVRSSVSATALPLGA